MDLYDRVFVEQKTDFRNLRKHLNLTLIARGFALLKSGWPILLR